MGSAGRPLWQVPNHKSPCDDTVMTEVDHVCELPYSMQLYRIGNWDLVRIGCRSLPYSYVTGSEFLDMLTAFIVYFRLSKYLMHPLRRNWF